ncbi:DUF4129 domain-containing protein [Pseudarthrobacter sp. P1]|uniref:DUF4129 domain-containing protein n=1 Tax=Pseudarthrobacter sp. P1 TaxID=3418418 RepID=UPI003CF8A198
MPVPSWAVGALARPGPAALDAPVLPGADEARRELAEELAKGVYQDAKPGLAQQIWAAVQDFFAGLLDSLHSLDGSLGVLLLVALAAAVIGLAIFFTRPRLNRRNAAVAAVFGSGTVLDARAHRGLAAAAADRGDFAAAVAEQFRALVRQGEERAVIEETPGRTAHEAAAGMGLAFGPLAAALDRAGELFNGIQYGSMPAAEADWRWLAELDASVAAMSPSVHDGGPAALAVPR